MRLLICDLDLILNNGMLRGCFKWVDCLWVKHRSKTLQNINWYEALNMWSFLDTEWWDASKMLRVGWLVVSKTPKWNIEKYKLIWGSWYVILTWYWIMGCFEDASSGLIAASSRLIACELNTEVKHYKI
jgi:hypothetical protein